MKELLANTLMMIIVLLAVLVPYLTHIIFLIGKADETGSAIALLIVGIIAFPVGWVHGVSVLLGFPWI